jgi:hypothetical protein
MMTGLGQPQINPSVQKGREKVSFLLRAETINKLVVDL